MWSKAEDGFKAVKVELKKPRLSFIEALRRFCSVPAAPRDREVIAMRAAARYFSGTEPFKANGVGRSCTGGWRLGRKALPPGIR
jgi:hypothetical protein